MLTIEEEQSNEKTDAYSLFLYAVRSPITRDYYLRRLRIFFNHVNLLPNGTMEERCNLFAANGTKDPSWAFNCIIKFLQFQKERVEEEKITGATLRNYVKSIKLFCEMADIPIAWKKITRGLPKSRRFADDRAPTLEEIQKICEYPDRRINGIVCVMSSSGIRLGAWDYLRWGNIEPIRRDGKVVASKILVYAGDDDQYISFMTPEAYFVLNNWMEYRKESGEKIDKSSWVMRQLWNTKEGHYHHGTIKESHKLKSSGVKRLLEDALWTQGLRKKSDLTRNRYEFQTNHGFRKWFKTQCEIAGMKSINIEMLMGHSIGISDSYYRITENELLEDYLKAIDLRVQCTRTETMQWREIGGLRENDSRITIAKVIYTLAKQPMSCVIFKREPFFKQSAFGIVAEDRLKTRAYGYTYYLLDWSAEDAKKNFEFYRDWKKDTDWSGFCFSDHIRPLDKKANERLRGDNESIVDYKRRMEGLDALEKSMYEIGKAFEKLNGPSKFDEEKDKVLFKEKQIEFNKISDYAIKTIIQLKESIMKNTDMILKDNPQKLTEWVVLDTLIHMTIQGMIPNETYRIPYVYLDVWEALEKAGLLKDMFYDEYGKELTRCNDCGKVIQTVINGLEVSKPPGGIWKCRDCS